MLAPIASVKFSGDGRHLAAVLEGRLYLLDAFSGQTLWRWQNGVSYAGPAVEATFSPDSRYLLSGVFWVCLAGCRLHGHSVLGVLGGEADRSHYDDCVDGDCTGW